MSARVPAVRLALLTGLLVAIVAANAAGWLEVGGRGGSRLGPTGFALVLGLFLVTAAASWAVPSARSSLILSASLIQLVGIHGPLNAAGSLAVWSLFYFVILHVKAFAAKSILVASFFAVPVLLGALDAGGPSQAILGIFFTVHFASNFVQRSLLYAYEGTVVKKVREAGFGSYLRNLIAAPLGAINMPPVGFAILETGFSRVNPLLPMMGMRQMALGTLYLVLNHEGRRHGLLPSLDTVLGVVHHLDTLTMVTASNLVLLGLFLDLTGHIHLAIGMMRVLGFDIPAGSDRPWLSSSVLDYWRRWNTYFRDAVLALGFYPAAFALKKRPLLAVGVAGALTFALSGALHSLSDALARPGALSARRLIEPMILFLAQGLLVVPLMIKEAADARHGKGRRMASGSDQPGVAGRIKKWGLIAITMSLVSILYVLLRRPFGGTVEETLSALATLPW